MMGEEDETFNPGRKLNLKGVSFSVDSILNFQVNNLQRVIYALVQSAQDSEDQLRSLQAEVSGIVSGADMVTQDDLEAKLAPLREENAELRKQLEERTKTSDDAIGTLKEQVKTVETVHHESVKTIKTIVKENHHTKQTLVQTAKDVEKTQEEHQMMKTEVQEGFGKVHVRFKTMKGEITEHVETSLKESQEGLLNKAMEALRAMEKLELRLNGKIEQVTDKLNEKVDLPTFSSAISEVKRSTQDFLTKVEHLEERYEVEMDSLVKRKASVEYVDEQLALKADKTELADKLSTADLTSILQTISANIDERVAKLQEEVDNLRASVDEELGNLETRMLENRGSGSSGDVARTLAGCLACGQPTEVAQGGVESRMNPGIVPKDPQPLSPSIAYGAEGQRVRWVLERKLNSALSKYVHSGAVPEKQALLGRQNQTVGKDGVMYKGRTDPDQGVMIEVSDLRADLHRGATITNHKVAPPLTPLRGEPLGGSPRARRGTPRTPRQTPPSAQSQPARAASSMDGAVTGSLAMPPIRPSSVLG